MRARRFVLTVAMVTALMLGTAVRTDLNYRSEITGAEDNDLANLLDKVSELKTPRTSRRLLKRPCGGAPIAISDASPMLPTVSAIGTRISLMRSTPQPTLPKLR
jgi:hypothetical protein